MTINTLITIDKLAAVRDVFEQFVPRCIESYTPGEYVTIDEILVELKGKCKFSQYIGNKPDKYGIQFYGLVDSQTFYSKKWMFIVVNNQKSQIDNDTSSVVKRLLGPINNSGRNLKTENYYTSVQLVNLFFLLITGLQCLVQ